MNKIEYGIELFNSGFNCAQSVFAPFSEDYDLDVETALRIAGGMGGGARAAELCGTVSGAVMVIGLRYGQETAENVDMKLKCNAETEEYVRRFREENGAVTCRGLLECDITTTEGWEQAVSKQLFATKCKDLVTSAIEILIDMGY